MVLYGWMCGCVRAQVGGSAVSPGGSTKVSQSVRLVAATQVSSRQRSTATQRAQHAPLLLAPPLAPHSHTNQPHPLSALGSRNPPLALRSLCAPSPPLAPAAHHHPQTHRHHQTRRPRHSHDSLSAQVLEGISTSVGTLLTLLGTCGGVDVCFAARWVGGEGTVKAGEVVLVWIGARCAVEVLLRRLWFVLLRLTSNYVRNCTRGWKTRRENNRGAMQG